jgi:hypothetical protein
MKQHHGFVCRRPEYKRPRTERYSLRRSPFKYEYARLPLVRRTYYCDLDVPILPKYYLAHKDWDSSDVYMDRETFGEAIGVASEGDSVSYKWVDSFVDRVRRQIESASITMNASFIHDVVPTSFEAQYDATMKPVDAHLLQKSFNAQREAAELARSMEDRIADFEALEQRRAEKSLLTPDDFIETGKPRMPSVQEIEWRAIKESYKQYLKALAELPEGATEAEFDELELGKRTQTQLA